MLNFILKLFNITPSKKNTIKRQQSNKCIQCLKEYFKNEEINEKIKSFFEINCIDFQNNDN